MTERIAFVNGVFVPEAEAAVSIFDLGFLYGDGVFETVCCRHGRLFKLDEHLDRLYRSLVYVRIDLPYPRDELRALIVETTARNGLDDAYVKCVVTRGVAERPALAAADARPGCVIFAIPYFSLAGDAVGGIRVRTSSLRRTPSTSLDPRVKSLNYLNVSLGVLEARSAGADTTILLDDDGLVTEGAGFNLFVVRAGGLATPVAGVLEGVTRATVLELARSLDLPAEEAELSLYDLYTADEVFLTSTAGGIVPVVEVDGRAVGNSAAGAVTSRIVDGYAELLESGAHGTAVLGHD